MNLRDLAEKVKGFIQQNPTPMGFAGKQIQQRVVQPTMQRINTAIPGGVQGGIQRVKQGNNYNFYQQAAQGNVPTFQPFKPVANFVGQFTKNRYVQPNLDIPKNYQAVTNKNLDWKERGMAGLGLANAVATWFPDPFQDAIFPVVDYFKGVSASSKRGGDWKQNIQSGLQAMSLEKPVGLGTAMTTDPVGEVIGNLAELPLSIGLTARMGKGQNLGFDKKTVEIARQGFTPQVKSMIKEFATQVETASDANKKNMGQLGDYIHTLAGAIWGDKNTANLTNKQLKNAFDILLQQVDNRAPMGRFYPIGLTMRDMREGTAPSTVKGIGKKAIEEANQIVRDALISGDEAGAKALYKDLSIDSKLNPFEQLKSEVSQMMKQELKSAESIQSSNYGEYEPLVKRMRSFLGMAGEKTSKETGELFREHIPRKVFGVSSDEVSTALGKTESEFMAELTNDLNMMGNATTRPQAIASFRQKVTRLKSIEDKLDPQFFKVIKSWDDKLQAVSVEPNPAFIKIRDEKARMKAARQEFEEWQRSYRQQTLPATPNTQASGVATQIKNATKSPVSKNPEQLKDISGWKAYMRDVYRNFKDVYGSRYEEVKRVILDPFDASKGRYVDMTEQWAKKLKTEIVDRLGIGKKSKESAAVQMYGEGKITTEELYKRFGEKKAQNIIEADKWFRQAYNELIDTVNATRKRIYPNNPEKWVAKRTDYYRHFREMKEGIGALFNIFDTPSNISSNLAGVSPVTKPKSKFLSIAQKREGDMSDLDAVGGFIDYIKQAAYATNIDPHIEQFRALSKELADTTGESKNLNTFIGYLENFANDLAGKTNPADRFIQEIIPGGRMTFRAINWLNNRVKANAVIGNVSSALSQIMNVPQGIADAGPINAVKGFGRTLAGIFAKDPAISKSTFVKERLSDPFGQFDTGMIKDAKKFAVWMTGILDKVGTKIIWNSQYEKALAKKLPNAVKFADDATRSLVAGRGIGEVPLLQKARTMQMIAPFQLEVENLWWVMKDWVDEKSFGKLATFFVVNHVMNQAISQIRGSDVTFDPIQSMMDGYNSFKNEDDKKKGALMFAGRQLGEVASNVPFGQTIASLYPEYGLQVGDSTLPTRKDFFGKGNPVRTGSGILAAEGLKDPLFKVIPPYGGSQIKKTIEGVTAFSKGASEDKKGNIRFPIEQNVPNAIKSTLFGQYATPEAREYFDKNRRALGEKQTALYKIASDKKAEYEAIMTKRAETALIDKAKEKMKAGNDKIQEVGTKVLIMQDNGDIATIDPSWMPEAPEMTGMAELDKKAISKFNSQITQKVNDIYELYKAGKLTEAEANDQIVQIKGLKLAGSKKAKAKKVTFKKTPYKTIKMSLPSASKVQNIKIAKAPKPKTAKSKAIKIANIKPIKVNKIKGLMVGTKLV